MTVLLFDTIRIMNLDVIDLKVRVHLPLLKILLHVGFRQLSQDTLNKLRIVLFLSLDVIVQTLVVVMIIVFDFLAEEV